MDYSQFVYLEGVDIFERSLVHPDSRLLGKTIDFPQNGMVAFIVF